MLDELSYSEWSALLILDRHSSTPRDPKENDLQWSYKFWMQFKADVEKELGIRAEEVSTYMNRIGRTGLYEQFVGGYLSYSGGVGMLTPRFYRLKQFVEATSQPDQS